MELRQRLPNIPLLCDPSHIGGSRKYIAPLSQDAFEMGFDGSMVESHWHPRTALSDAEQQLTPMQYGRLVRQLLDSSGTVTPSGDQGVRSLYKEIDEIDEDLSVLLAKRLSLFREVEKSGPKKNVLHAKPTKPICVTRDCGEHRKAIAERIRAQA